MTTYKLLLVNVLVALTITASAQTATTVNDTITNAIKVSQLIQRKAKIRQLLKVEDSKRNQTYNGVAPETQESLNDRQDSICLELRSQMVEVELELKEVNPDGMLPVATISTHNKINSSKATSSSGVKKK
jgi:Na+-translocating ferredoxin:NAD+ oxidoreductase RnfG subunit